MTTPDATDRASRLRGGGCRLYLITPPRFELAAFADDLARALDAGDVACLQLRMKGANDDSVRRAADALIPLSHARDAAVVMNDCPDLARETGCDGVHIGQSDARYDQARRATTSPSARSSKPARKVRSTGRSPKSSAGGARPPSFPASPSAASRPRTAPRSSRPAPISWPSCPRSGTTRWRPPGRCASSTPPSRGHALAPFAEVPRREGARVALAQAR